ncbi:RidA family protein [Chloroflexota bacterium]
MPKQVLKLSTPTTFPPGIPAGIPYSSGTKAGGFVFVSGQVGPIDYKGKEIKGVEAQTRQLLENVKNILEAGGASLSDVVKTTVFLLDVSEFAAMNKVYGEYFPKECPARSTVIISALAKPEWQVEIECIAYHP